MTRVLVRPKGLVLDANTIAPVDGAMREASNAVCDQPGVVRSRQTNTVMVSKDFGGDATYVPRAITLYGGTPYTYTTDGAGSWRVETSAATIDASADLPAQAVVPRFLQSRGTLYYTSSDGLRRYNATDSAAMLAGVEAWTGPFAQGVVRVSGALGTTLAGGPLPGTPLQGRVYFDPTLVRAGDVFEWYKTRGASSFVVYVVIKRTDGDGYVRRSPPTRLPFEGTAVPETDAYLWQTYTVTSADVLAGYFLAERVISVAPDESDVFVSDAVNDDLLGAALYTNPGQQGSLGARYLPPCAAEIATWGGVTWFGNTRSKHRLTCSLQNVAGSTQFSGVDDTNPLGLFGALTAGTLLSGTTTNGSSVIAGVTDDLEKFLRAGQYITDRALGPSGAGTAFPADTLIVSWAVGVAPGTIDITCSKNATASGLRSVYVGDVVSVGGRNFYAWTQDDTWSPDTGFDGARRCFAVASTAISATGRNAYTAFFLAAAINYESVVDSTFRVRAVLLGEPYVYSSVVSAPSDLLLEEIGVGGSAFTVDSSAPWCFSPNLDGLTSDNDEGPGLLWYSEPDEPEAVPLPNYFVVGRREEPILALTPLRDSLLVWKRDGLYRVIGTAPDSWRVDAVDTATRLLAPNAVDVGDGAAYGWTADSGLVRATESGVEPVSQPIDDLLRTFASMTLDDGSDTPWVCCWRTESLVLLGVQTDDPGAARVYALSTITGAWSLFWQRGTDEITCATYDQATARLYWCRGARWEVRRFDREPKGYDATYALTSPTCSTPFTALTVASADVGMWEPMAGDWIARTVGLVTSYARISAAVLDAGTWTLTLDAGLAGGSGGGATFVGYEGLPSGMEWQQVGPPGAWEFIREMRVHLDASVDGATALPGSMLLAMGGTSSLAAVSTVSSSVPDPTTYSRPYRYGVPRAIARHAHLYPRVEINALGYPWRLHTLAVIGDAGSERVRR